MEIAEDAPRLEEGYTFDWTEAESVAAAVVRATARVSGEDPADQDPLYSAVDPDALDALFDAHRNHPELVVDFVYEGRRVRVSATGTGYISATD